MERHPLRSLSPLRRWARRRLQAAPSLGVFFLVFASGCAGNPPRPERHALLHRAPADEVVIRTDRFAFHMGKAVETTWPADAERTRAVLGTALETLLEDEDAAVTVLARQLGVAWPEDPLDFDVTLRSESGRDDTGPCDPSVSTLPTRLVLARSGEHASSFFACVLARSFSRLRDASRLHRAMAASAKDAAHAAQLYGCVVGVAIGALRVAGADGANAARAIEQDARLDDLCSPREIEWVSRAWLTRVREEETAEAFGARASAELAHEGD